uniref:Uncharacterized protein n=1 Tax=Arundo donax TaxID=35708 RepID=A0A0A8ZI48_ARUDO
MYVPCLHLLDDFVCSACT